MALGDIYDKVSNVINRGTKFDTELIEYVRQATRFLERNYNWQHMKKFNATSIDLTDGDRTYPLSTIISDPTALKKINFWRIMASTATASYIEEVDPEDILDRSEEKPTHFWLDHTVATAPVLTLVEEPDTAYANTEIGWYEYTTWATASATSNWWTLNGDDAVVYQTLIMMGARLRLSQKQLAIITQLRNDSLETLGVAKDELERGASDEQMAF